MNSNNRLTLVVVGGGAAGFFSAITAAQAFPQHRIILLEKGGQVLSKVRISGGGRCNVTHACFDPALLVKNYPRGSKELRGPFSRFQPSDTIQWFESRGVSLKTEEDGRMFPVTDQSETIIHCFLSEVAHSGVELHRNLGIQEIHPVDHGGFNLTLTNLSTLYCDRLLVATGSSPKIYPILAALGHTIVPLVPSLFTFNIPNSPFFELSGVALPSVSVSLPQFKIEQKGALLFTHWGLSGPAILKLSAWAAREMHAVDYHTPVVINWIPDFSSEEIQRLFSESKRKWGAKQIGTEPLFSLPKQLWKKLLFICAIPETLRWSMVSNKQQSELITQLCGTTLSIEGKTTYKQEFVTSGGVLLEEVNFKTMESRCCPGLYFAGEVLNIDGVTGGFNFQNAWTTAWIAGNSVF